ADRHDGRSDPKQIAAMVPPSVREASLRPLIAAMAFGASLLAFLILLGIGAFLAGVEESGARGAGLLLALSAVVAFGAALFLIWAPKGYFGRRLRRPLGVVVTLAAAAPVATLAGAALVFTGVPLGTRLPLMDWPIFAAGLALGLGGVCILAAGYRRLSETAGRVEPAAWAERESAVESPAADTDDSEIRVRRV
ncbi:MAG TPA: hypothetical protein VN240_07620, partial [Propylenella sp.]|nr:hypothetical protein [Propylenella sp.]